MGVENNDLIIIGGGAAGFTAALYAKKFNFNAKITLITNEREFYSRCSLPFVISGELEIGKISHSIEEMCKNSGISCVIDEVISVDKKKKIVKTKNNKEFFYNSLVIATGSKPIIIPKILGVEKEGVFYLKNLEDVKKILDYSKKVKKVVVIGGGAIGVEISCSLKKLGKNVTLVELLPSVLKTCFSMDFSEIIREKLEEKGVKVITGNSIEKILGKDDDKKVSGVVLSNGEKIPVEMVIIAVGVEPNVEIAKKAGIEIENFGIKVNERMETSEKGIFAAGDCTCFKSLITKKQILSQLGTTAIREGKVAGINALGGNENLRGLLNSIILKIFDLEVGKTGLNEEEAKKEGFSTVVTGKIKTFSKEEYYSDAKDLFVKLIFNKEDERILGCEIIGGEGVAEKVDLIAFAIEKKATIDDIKKLDYCYTPPIISANNALVLAAENAKKKIEKNKTNEFIV